MKEFLGCCFCSMLAGVAVGAIITTKNKTIADYVKKGTNLVEDKIEGIKQNIDKAKKSTK